MKEYSDFSDNSFFQCQLQLCVCYLFSASLDSCCLSRSFHALGKAGTLSLGWEGLGMRTNPKWEECKDWIDLKMSFFPQSITLKFKFPTTSDECLEQRQDNVWMPSFNEACFLCKTRIPDSDPVGKGPCPGGLGINELPELETCDPPMRICFLIKTCLGWCSSKKSQQCLWGECSAGGSFKAAASQCHLCNLLASFSYSGDWPSNIFPVSLHNNN